MTSSRPPVPRDTTLRGDLALATVCALALTAVLFQALAPSRPRAVSHEEALGMVEARSKDVRRRSRAAAPRTASS